MPYDENPYPHKETAVNMRIAADAVELEDKIEIAGEEFTVVLIGANRGDKVMLCLQDFPTSDNFVWLTLEPHRTIRVRRNR